MDFARYLPYYRNSWALVIGINEYQYVQPLSYACNDADAVTEVLVSELNFAEGQAVLLKDESATKQAILEAYLNLIHEASDPNDRVLIFYAGHGITVDSMSGPVGYLIPSDGDPQNYSTLIRWDDLTRNADLIPAKHILFIMDACYSGLATTRGTPPGTQRFLDDMLQRPVRQVITAGKADEQVADGGGLEGTNSIFTGYLIEGLRGAAADENGIVTANELMAYVYRKVSQDNRSKQTPHYGNLLGDGDFVLRTPEDIDLGQEPQTKVILGSGVELTGVVNPTISHHEFDSFAARNGYIDPDHPNFGRNDWSEKLAEFRSGRNTSREVSKAYSWFSLIVEPTSKQRVFIDSVDQVDQLRSHHPSGGQPFERFKIPRSLLTTVESVILYDEIGHQTDLWERYLRIDQNGNIEYVNAAVFFEWEGIRRFRYVQLIGEVWQFIYFAKKALSDEGYVGTVRLLFNLVGTKDTILDDFSQEKGEDNKIWKKPYGLWMEGSQNLKCHNRNIQLEYVLSLTSLDEVKSKEVIKDIAKRLGLAYNHQSAPRCFNFNTDVFPWDQFFRGRSW